MIRHLPVQEMQMETVAASCISTEVLIVSDQCRTSLAPTHGANLYGMLKHHWNKSEIWYQLSCKTKYNIPNKLKWHVALSACYKSLIFNLKKNVYNFY
jgi:hypothetical protein